ncbi:hypothetical protein JW948_09555 [bacterium]|nr:hypothetical protein [bacterium]
MTLLTESELLELEGGKKLACAVYIFQSLAVAGIGAAALGPVVGAVAFGFMMAKAPC